VPNPSEVPSTSSGLEARKEEIVQGIDQEFKEFVQSEIQLKEQFYLEDVKRGFTTPERAAAELEKTQQEYKALIDFNDRVRAVTNNFFMWWPSGWHRQIIEEAGSTRQFPDMAAYNKFVEDFDRTIEESGYIDMVPMVLNNNRKGTDPVLWDKRMLIMADVYLKMRQRGYDRKTLVA